MNRSLPNFSEACEGVKLKHFVDKGMDISGVIHVGTNWGEEIMYYLGMGIDRIIGFEPLESAFTGCYNAYFDEIQAGKVKLFNYGLGATFSRRSIREVTDRSSRDNGSSSFLEEANGLPSTHSVIPQPAVIKPFDLFLSENPEVEPEEYNCLVVDVQGMELEVLQGIGSHLHNFSMLNIECSSKPIYKGEAPAVNVIEFLKHFGFRPDTPIESHNDILFVRANGN